jgi:hypothetical protein
LLRGLGWIRLRSLRLIRLRRLIGELPHGLLLLRLRVVNRLAGRNIARLTGGRVVTGGGLRGGAIGSVLRGGVAGAGSGRDGYDKTKPTQMSFHLQSLLLP